jgi:hypothetical protein
MKAKISKIILWPKRADKKPRVIKFEMNGVEVLTGKSQTGKSSLIPIVDYCLGSGKCAIPVGEIREHAEWFGVVLRLPDAEMLLARRNPGLQAQTTEMYFDMGEQVVIPDSLDGLSRTNSSTVVAQLNQLAGLPSLSLTGGDEGGFTARPSFRDTAAFQFQPQHIVANPYTLFFKADTVEHQDKLKNVFPLVLGAIDNAALELRRQMRVLETELKQARDLLEDRKLRSATWMQEFRTFYSQGRALGLLPEAPDSASDWTTEKYVGYLTPVPLRIKQNPFPQIERGASKRLAREIAALRKSEDSIATALSDRQRKLSRIEKLRSATDGYSQTLIVQGQRLQPFPWFADHIAETHECPVCGSDTDTAAKEIKHLESLARDVAANVGTVESVNLVLDKEAATLEEDLRQLESEGNEVRQQLKGLDEASQELRTQRQTINELHNFGGRLEQELKKFAEGDQGNDIERKVTALQNQVTDLRRRLDPNAVLRLQDEALTSIGEVIRHYAEILGVEHHERSVRIDIRNLTLAVDGPQGRKDYLWEIGSAANWMGYHVAALLALHEHFIKMGERGVSPVPQFLFIDQPTQAFFPERLGARAQKGKPEEPEMDSDDVARVQRIFRAVSDAIQRTGSRLQIIVIDHVGETAWEGISDVRVIERWRDGEALIPSEWR